LRFASTVDDDDFLALLALRVAGIVNGPVRRACHNHCIRVLYSTRGKNVPRGEADQLRGRCDSGYNYSLSELPPTQAGDRPVT
jgi:hypothetical protein